MTFPIQKIISGGQTGADRAALDFALLHKIPHGGWCPKGRKAEDGLINSVYDLQETPAADYAERTEWNIRDSDATVIFSIGEKLEGGSLLTLKLAKKLGKPVLHVSQNTLLDSFHELDSFIKKNQVAVLNVAGPRASKEPGVYDFAWQVLERVIV